MIVLVVIIVKRGQTDLYYIQNQNSVDSLRRERASKKKKKQFARCCVYPYSYFNLEGHVRVCVFSAARFVLPRIIIPV